tara:strand:+ start:1824 stop:2399 length:576 start_codon:yes stop_codon:yes gene_type:complete
MHHCFHHIPKTGGSSLRIRLEDRADKKQISKLDYAIGHNTTTRTPGTHFVWLRNPLDRDISQFNYDTGKGEAEGKTFEEHCRRLAGNFMTLWLYKNYLLEDPNTGIHGKYLKVKEALNLRFDKVFSTQNFEDSWDYVADKLMIDREPRLKTNISNENYKKYADKNDLSEEFVSWHKNYNHYDYLLYQEFCT